MASTFGLTDNTETLERLVRIGEEDGAALFRGMETANLALIVEERFDNISENFFDLESYILNFALRTSFSVQAGSEKFPEFQRQTSRLLGNLLSSCRAYLDRTDKELAEHTALGSVRDSFSAERSSAFDNHVEYRLMESMRNYIQHRGDPVRGVAMTGKPRPEAYAYEYQVFPTVCIESLADTGFFKKGIIDDIVTKYPRRQQAPKGQTPIDIRHFTRKYCTCLASIHGAVRRQIDGELRTARLTISSCSLRFKNAYLDEVNGSISVVELAKDDRLVRSRSLHDRYFAARDELATKNPCMEFESSHVVSNALLGT